ncbi:glycoside hydrolase family 61 protein [Coprinopsis sp. MPI-PUGE-AT-0042]|nr:glycoside hydrolase family 61 protein [Coprinopsis sp. MPI-PUGE-AT-0042]
MKYLLPIALLVTLASSVVAHTIFQELHVNGVSAGHTIGIRVPTSNTPLFDVASNDIICNGGVNPYRQPVSNVVIPVPAGANITAEWHRDLNGATGNADDPLFSSHMGPIMAYLAKVPSATQTDVTGLKWFKIYHDGYNPSAKYDQQWATTKLIVNKGNVSFSIPECLASGEYLLRVELIALHAASILQGAQFHMGCAQIKVSGSGDVIPADTVSFPGAYTARDPGILISLFPGVTNYTIPGPAPFTC